MLYTLILRFSFTSHNTMPLHAIAIAAFDYCRHYDTPLFAAAIAVAAFLFADTLHSFRCLIFARYAAFFSPPITSPFLPALIITLITIISFADAFKMFVCYCHAFSTDYVFRTMAAD